MSLTGKAAEGAPAWDRLLATLPSVADQFRSARATLPFIHAPRVSFRSARVAGSTWALLPSAAGVIDPLTNFVEHPEVVADRLENVARTIGDPTRLLAGTDCGFDTSAGRGRVAEDVVWAKLTAMAEGARRGIAFFPTPNRAIT